LESDRDTAVGTISIPFAEGLVGRLGVGTVWVRRVRVARPGAIDYE
jgi:hypothetical protein